VADDRVVAVQGLATPLQVRELKSDVMLVVGEIVMGLE
jgi:hypothetical protein